MLDSFKKNVSKAKNSVSSTLNEVKETVSETLDDAQFHLEKNYKSTFDNISETIDDGVSVVKRTAKSIYDGIDNLKELGITISMVVAPVPTTIFITILWLKNLDIGDKNPEEVQNTQKRKYESAIALLKKYGKIPQTATIKNEFIELEMNVETGQVTGLILAGDHAGKQLSELDQDQVQELIKTAPSKETKDIIDAWSKYNHKVD